MPKNIVILFDGTSNGITSERTNVLRLYGVLEKSERQVVWYDPGVGTFGADNAWSRTWRKAVEVWGLATGWGLDQNVKEAYRFLVENYSEDAAEQKDRVFVFGFSRGAYTARVLAGFLHNFGLVAPENLNLVDYAYRAYKRIGENPREEAFAETRLYERILRPTRPAIRLLGLFDTVASVIESGRFGPRLRSHASTSKNPSVQSIVHAVAIDERRTMFRPLLWPGGKDWQPNPFAGDKAAPQDVREVWFAGHHCDVGGGYREADSSLCKVPLEWMVEQATSCGLLVKARSVKQVVKGEGDSGEHVAPDPLSKTRGSMRGLWPLVEFLPRRLPSGSRRASILGFTLPLFERRAVPEGAVLHRSVIERREATGYWPPNLSADHIEWKGDIPSERDAVPGDLNRGQR